jgi:flavin reductase (DIM6/NTAB) family NADH-FMN oxidoreductase RutF
MEQLPQWDDGTVAVLCTGGGVPHAIPVSTAVQVGPRTIVLALARRRESLARLRADPQVALVLLARDVACTAHATATVTQDPLAGAERVAAVRLDVHGLQDHRQPTFAMDEGVRWHWTDPEAQARDAEIRALLRRTAGG